MGKHGDNMYGAKVGLSLYAKLLVFTNPFLIMVIGDDVV